MAIHIKGGRVIDPGHCDGMFDLYIENGKILKMVTPGAAPKDMSVDQVIDATGMLVLPGLIDMHVHLRDPGFEYKESIETGCRAAVHGGFTAVCAMPNTRPVNDNRQVTEYMIRMANQAGFARVYPAAAISVGSKGQALSEYGDLKDAGAVALTDDGLPVENGQMMRRALEYAKGFNLPIISHCEDMSLAAGGCMNEGVVATRLGLPGIPNISESIMVMRDIGLCELTGGRLHIAHVSTEESVQAIRDAKKRGVPVTAETAPHYFTLTEAAIVDFDTHAKMNPPLRTEKDRAAICQGLADGTLDVIATDHAPHSPLEKNVEFNMAANGIIGLETALPLSLKLVTDGVLTLDAMIRKMTINPASILGIPTGIREGGIADITIIDPDREYILKADELYSKSRNTPFDGWTMRGKALYTLVNGRVVYKEPS
ncbi:MAG: dihydroorotase [Proteobacteria bacterium]|nr:dihydroorotase [Pseudomonadota bacterium]